MGLHGPGWLYVLGRPPRGYLRLRTPRARATDLGQGPHLRRGVRTVSQHAPDTRAREKTRGRKRTKYRCGQKTHLYILIYSSIIVLTFPSIGSQGQYLFNSKPCLLTAVAQVQLLLGHSSSITSTSNSKGADQHQQYHVQLPMVHVSSITNYVRQKL